jgi:type 1 glutamine amidotransferase
LTAADPGPARKKIVLIAGKKSHGPEGNRIHDYPWSVRLLKVLLDRSNIRAQVRVETHFGGWPADERTLDDADSIMVISDGRDGDKFEEAPHFQSAARTAQIERQIRRGCGFITFHFSTFASEDSRRQILEWSGGYFQWETAGARKWYSAIKVHEDELVLPTPGHAIARGVTPFRLKEEFYYNLRFDPDDKALVPLLSVPTLPGRDPDGRWVAWARERADGGRGFGTSCGHFYDNWKNDGFRKLMLNAIAWSAHVEVPENGVTSSYLEHGEITAALAAEAPSTPANPDPAQR